MRNWKIEQTYLIKLNEQQLRWGQECVEETFPFKVNKLESWVVNLQGEGARSYANVRTRNKSIN